MEELGARLVGRIGKVQIFIGEVTAPVPQPEWRDVLEEYEDAARAPTSVVLSVSTYARLRAYCERHRPDLLKTLRSLDEPA
jgi:hypothetical protein